jgi:hypothetical protein
MLAANGLSVDDLTKVGSSSNSTTSEWSSANYKSDWRRSIADYMQDPSQNVDIIVWRLALKYTLTNSDLYRRTTDVILL